MVELSDRMFSVLISEHRRGIMRHFQLTLTDTRVISSHHTSEANYI